MTKNSYFIFVVLYYALLFLNTQGIGQLSITNLSDYQYGNLPRSGPKDLSTLYDRVDLQFRKWSGKVGFRYEIFESSDHTTSYDHLAQRYIEWQQGAINLRVGHFYTTLGRGLILRAFELPNVIFEQRQFRRRYAYYRDLDGVLLESNWEKLELLAFTGTVLNNVFPPGLPDIDRRFVDLYGGQIKLRPSNSLMIGDAFAKMTPHDRTEQTYNSAFIELSLKSVFRSLGYNRTSIRIYAEHARVNSKFADFIEANQNNPNASYYSATLTHNRFGLSAEYKDYRGFENRINLPPIVYKEHTYYLLNRLSHELLSDNEQGYQFEMNWRPVDEIFLVANSSYAKNDFSFSRFQFQDHFLEMSWYASPQLLIKSFYDWGRDDQKGHSSRQTGGVDIDWQFHGSWAVVTDLQHQIIEQSFFKGDKSEFTNNYLSLALTHTPGFSVAMGITRSTDITETDDPATLRLEKDPKYWLNFTATYDISLKHQLSIFYGKRRGGLICLSGSCFEVLPFKGLQVRWIFQY